jgi:hypothetical protein
VHCRRGILPTAAENSESANGPFLPGTAWRDVHETRLAAAVRPHVKVRTSLAQELRAHHLLEEHVTGLGIESPQTPRLRLGQGQARHLEILGTQQLPPFVDGLL